jgi:hypothetical protein
MHSTVEEASDRPQSWSSTHQTFETALDFPLLDILLPLHPFEHSKSNMSAISFVSQAPHCAMRDALSCELTARLGAKRISVKLSAFDNLHGVRGPCRTGVYLGPPPALS